MVYGAGDEIRTRDIYLGKVVLYQLSYSRDRERGGWNVGTAIRRFLHDLSSVIHGLEKYKNPRADLLFRDAAIQVPLAQLRFTTQFGMEWGGSAAL